jgi:hypothetical protein
VTRSPSATLGILSPMRASGPFAPFALAFVITSGVPAPREGLAKKKGDALASTVGNSSDHVLMYGIEAGYGFKILGVLTSRPQSRPRKLHPFVLDK